VDWKYFVFGSQNAIVENNKDDEVEWRHGQALTPENLQKIRQTYHRINKSHIILLEVPHAIFSVYVLG